MEFFEAEVPNRIQNNNCIIVDDDSLEMVIVATLSRVNPYTHFRRI